MTRVNAGPREVTARTEQYWCPIKHERQPAGAHDRYGGFIEYGDAASFEPRSRELRWRLAEDGAQAPNAPRIARLP